MAERFTKLYQQEAFRYAAQCPLMITGASLLADSYSRDLLCQLKLRSLSEQPIKAATVEIQMLDIAGDPLPPLKQFQYLDLQVERDGEFGQQTAIVLPRRDARGIRAQVSELVYDDNSRWHGGTDCLWTTLEPPRRLEDAYGDRELAEQFRIRYGGDCRYQLLEEQDLWFCTCGACNRAEESSCHHCHRVRSALLDVNTDALRQESASRLKYEQAHQEQLRQEARQTNRKRLKIAAVVLPLLILAAGLLSTVPHYIQQKQAYDTAASLLARRQYEQAEEAFRQLGSYRDSDEQVEKNIPYQRALYLYSCAEKDDASALGMIGHSRADLSEDVTAATLLYESAMEQFKALGNYKESRAYVDNCALGMERVHQALLQRSYEEARQLLEEQQFSLAREAFLALEDFSDSEELAQEAVYQKAAALYDFICKYDVRQIYADISFTPGRGTVFSLPKAKALELGSQCVADLRAAVGGDLVDVNLVDSPASNLHPLAECVIGVFTDLNGYKDSEERIAGIRDATDYTKDFFMLCEAGDIYGAFDWLSEYEGDFPDRSRWMGILDLYKPYCGSWSLYLGDVTVIPMTIGRNTECRSFNTRVILSDERAILRISPNDGEDYFLDLGTELGNTGFANYTDYNYNYLLAMTAGGHLSYMQYDDATNLRSSCEYERAE